ncbi:hypothetical protein HID58_036418 [Brassica napus]|uniref:Peptidase C14 caspase domain-containing protein n=1 Tax=Brassica napus TaxID=3708 RepID=A0ABQ8C7P5_BRANA|nr:hypothetical protein HID58_036418 [Brassica napus]
MAKKALLIGINYPGTAVELRGCVNDVRRMQKCLIDRYGFSNKDITVLIDTDKTSIQPTGKNIREALKKLIAEGEPGDVLVFHYSGHGTRLPTEEGLFDATDYDECITPCDMNLITDMVAEVKKGCLLTIISDSCHSGGLIEEAKEQIGESYVNKPRSRIVTFLVSIVRSLLTTCGISSNDSQRGSGGGHDSFTRESELEDGETVDMKTRYLPLDSYITLLKEQTGQTDIKYGKIRQTLVKVFGQDSSPNVMLSNSVKRNAHRGLLSMFVGKREVNTDGAGSEVKSKHPNNGILLSGCQTDQRSEDVYVTRTGKSYGAFSDAIQTILSGTRKEITNKEMVLRAREILKKQKFGQRPAIMATTASFFTIASSFSEPRIQIRSSKRTSLSLQYSIPYKANSRSRRRLVVSSVSAPKVELRTGPDYLISSLLSKVCIASLQRPQLPWAVDPLRLLLPKSPQSVQNVILTFLVSGVVFIPLGAICLFASQGVIEIVDQYDIDCIPLSFRDNKVRYIQGIEDKRCNRTITVTKTMKNPVYVYYQLENYYQNHRRYVKSRQDGQLRSPKDENDVKSCAPEDTVGGEPIVPCGLVAWSLFNDTYDFTRNNQKLSVNKKDISWKSDRDSKFGKNVFPKNFQKGFPIGGKSLDPKIPLSEQEDLIVWMRTAALPIFRKLYGKIDTDLEAGDTINVLLQNNYNTYSFNGKKKLVLSTTSWLGGRNDFLGIAYLTVGSICLSLAVFFSVLYLAKPRQLGDPSYLSWNRSAGGGR